MAIEGYEGRQRRSIRLPAFDYATTGAYFVTLVADDRDCIFGDVADGEVRLTAIGRIVEDEWLNTAVVRESVEVDAFVVMPNHVHGILWILGESPVASVKGTPPRAPTTRVSAPDEQDTSPRAPTTWVGAPDEQGTPPRGSTTWVGAPDEQGTPPRAPTVRRFGRPVSRSLSTIINNFKGRVTTRTHELTGVADQRVWQRGFYERVVRDEAELLGIREYIIANPRLWSEDEENPASKV